MKLTAALFVSLSLFGSVALLSACEDKKPTSASKGDTATAKDDHEHGPGGAHTDAADDHASHSGKVIDLGSTKAGSFDLKVTRDEGPIVAGKDAAIDATVTASAGGTAKVKAVRFWIGTEDAKGSVKAKADIEDPKEPNRWHTHAVIPSPLPAGSKLWIEIESDKGEKSVVSFDLKA